MSYILLLLTTGLVVLFGLFAWFYHKTTKLNAELGFLSNNYLETSKQNQILQQEKISYIQKIEQLSSKVDYQNQLIAEADKSRQESYVSAKNALFDLGNELSKQLIEIHRRENQEARELSEKNISGATSKFNNEFERLINMVGSLSRDIEQSKGTVDIIKQSLLSPSGSWITC